MFARNALPDYVEKKAFDRMERAKAIITWLRAYPSRAAATAQMLLRPVDVVNHLCPDFFQAP
ncbi:MAG: hypothetical protein WD847_03070 [Pirellulales bacterium]